MSSQQATNYEGNIHQVGLTVAWSLIINASIISGALRFDSVAAMTHIIFGWCLLIYSYILVLYFLIPYGFNVANPDDKPRYAHGVVGTMLLGFVIIQIVMGLVARKLQQNK